MEIRGSGPNHLRRAQVGALASPGFPDPNLINHLPMLVIAFLTLPGGRLWQGPRRASAPKLADSSILSRSVVLPRFRPGLRQSLPDSGYSWRCADAARDRLGLFAERGDRRVSSGANR